MRTRLTRIAAAAAIALSPAAAHALPALIGLAASASAAGIFGAALTIGIGTAFAINVGLAIYGAAAARRKARKAEARAKAERNASLTDRMVTVVQETPPWRVIYGHPGPVGGDIVDIVTSDKPGRVFKGFQTVKPDAYKSLVVHVATHEVQSIGEVYIDGVPVGPLDVNGWATSGEFVTVEEASRSVDISGPGSVTVAETVVRVVSSFVPDAPAGNFNDGSMLSADISLSNGNKTLTTTTPGTVQVFYTVNAVTSSGVNIQKHLGTDSQAADAFLVGLAPTKWTADHRLRGIAYVIVTLDLENVRFQGGPPNLTFDVRGKKILDTRTSQTAYSANNALVINDWLKAPWGFGCAATDIDSSYVNAAANACDFLVNFAPNSPEDGQRYDFTPGAEGFVSNGNASVSVSGGILTLTSTAANPELFSPGLSFFGGTRQRVRARIRRTAGLLANWEGTVFYATAGHGFSASFRKAVANPIAQINEWVEVEWDMTSLTAGGNDWAVSEILQVRIDLGTAASDVFQIDWIVFTAPMPTYTCNGAFTSDQSRESVLEDLCESMAGFAVYGAKWQVIAGSWTAPVLDLDDSDLMGQIEVVQAGAPASDIFNGVRGTFIASDKASPTDFDPYQNSVFVAADGVELWSDFELPFTSDKARCKNLARVFVERARQGLVIRYPAKLSAWPLQAGDRVRVSSTEYGFDLKAFRVTDWQNALTTPVVLTLQEDDASVYDLADAATSDPAPNTALPSPWVVESLLGLTAASGTAQLFRTLDGTIVPRVKVSWTAPTGAYTNSGTAGVEVRWLRNGEQDWHTESLPFDSTSVHVGGVRESDRLVIEARFRNSFGQSGPRTIIGHTVVGKTQPPANVTGFVHAITSSGVQFSWTPNTELDYADTELRVGNSGYANASRLFKGAASTWTWPFPAAGVYTVRAKHYDSTKHESAVEAVVSVTVDAQAQAQWGDIAGRPKLFRVVSRGGLDTGIAVAAGIYDGETGATIDAGPVRSHQMVRIRRADGVITFSRQYDVNGLGAVGGFSATHLAFDLNATGPDSIVVINTNDEAQANRLTAGLEAAMYRCGASRGVFGSPEFKFRSAYVLIGIGGCEEGNGFEQYMGAVDNASTAWCDVALSLLNGNFLASGSGAAARTLRDLSYTGSLNATTDVTLIVGHGTATLTGNTASKPLTAAAEWDTDIYSAEAYTGGAFAQGTVGTGVSNMMIGLNSDPATNGSYETIDFAAYYFTGGLAVYESGVPIGQLAVAAEGDVVSVTYDGDSVRYMLNGLLLRTVAVAPNLKLFLDSSIHTPGASWRNIAFGPLSSVTDIATRQLEAGAATEVLEAIDPGPFQTSGGGAGGGFALYRKAPVVFTVSTDCKVLVRSSAAVEILSQAGSGGFNQYVLGILPQLERLSDGAFLGSGLFENVSSRLNNGETDALSLSRKMSVDIQANIAYRAWMTIVEPNSIFQASALRTWTSMNCTVEVIKR